MLRSGFRCACPPPASSAPPVPGRRLPPRFGGGGVRPVTSWAHGSCWDLGAGAADSKTPGCWAVSRQRRVDLGPQYRLSPLKKYLSVIQYPSGGGGRSVVLSPPYPLAPFSLSSLPAWPPQPPASHASPSGAASLADAVHHAPDDSDPDAASSSYHPRPPAASTTLHSRPHSSASACYDATTAPPGARSA
jgi:hypothetical protein